MPRLPTPPGLHPSELLAGLGGLVLALAMLLGDWFDQQLLGGITGHGTGEPPKQLDAWQAFGFLVVPLALAAGFPLAHSVLRLARAAALRPVALAAAGAAAVSLLLIGAGTTVQSAQAPLPDAVYPLTAPRTGLLTGLAGALAIVFGGLLAVRGRPRFLGESGVGLLVLSGLCLAALSHMSR